MVMFPAHFIPVIGHNKNVFIFLLYSRNKAMCSMQALQYMVRKRSGFHLYFSHFLYFLFLIPSPRAGPSDEGGQRHVGDTTSGADGLHQAGRDNSTCILPRQTLHLPLSKRYGVFSFLRNSLFEG